jgi:hypothetical protein
MEFVMQKIFAFFTSAAILITPILGSSHVMAKPASSKNIKQYAADSKADKARSQAKFDAQRAAKKAKQK